MFKNLAEKASHMCDEVRNLRRAETQKEPLRNRMEHYGKGWTWWPYQQARHRQKWVNKQEKLVHIDPPDGHMQKVKSWQI